MHARDDSLKGNLIKDEKFQGCTFFQQAYPVPG